MKRAVLVVALASCAHAPNAVSPREVVSLGPDRPRLVPAVDGLQPWVLRVDKGRVVRVRDGGVEDVSARYGVDKVAVVDFCALEGGAAFFGAKETVVVRSGTAQTFAIGGAHHACGGSNVARSDGHGVDFYDGAWTHFSMNGHIAIDGQGALWVARGSLLYRAQHGALVLEHDAGAHIDALQDVDGRLVLRQGNVLSRFDGTKRIPLDGVDAVQASRIVFAPVAAVHPVDFEAIRPIIQHSCGTCHLYGGAGGFELRTEDRWTKYRDRIRARVIEDRDMPPTGANASVQLTEAERDTISRWSSR